MTSPSTIPAALRRVDDLIGPNRQWSPTNDQQRSFLEIHEIVRDEVARVPEIESIASWSAAEINAFLRQRGFSIQLPPLPPDGFGTAAALDVLLTWLAPGTDLPLTTPDQQTYPSVLMHSLAPSYSVPGHSNPVIALPTRTEDQVYLTMLDAPPQDELTMIAT